MSSTDVPAAGWCWVDGEAEERVPAFDRGLQFGDGLFETFAVIDGGIPRWAVHRTRLRRGLGLLGLGQVNLAGLDVEVRRLVADVRGHWVGKLIVTRGSSFRGYRPPPASEPRRILTLNPWPQRPASHWREGVSVRLCEMRLGNQPALAGIKHLNRLENVLARAEWNGDVPAEGLMCDQRGRLVEGTMSNLFVRFGDRVLTSPLLDCGVAGTMRDWVIERLRRESSPELLYESIMPADLPRADEVFLSNSLFGLWPVRSLEGGQASGWSAGECVRGLQAEALAAMPWLGSGYDGPLD